MNTFLLMFLICVAVQRAYSKTIFDYNINPEYDLVAEESSARHTNFWPRAEYYVAPRRRYKHHVRESGYGSYHGKRRHELPHYAAEFSGGYLYPDSSDQYDYFDQSFHSPHFHHPHGLPPGQAKKNGRPHVIPPRFPPPPVYDKNFLNPWTLSATPSKPFIGQLPPLTTPQPAFERHPHITTPEIHVATKTQSPLSSTTTADHSMYDIDVRFGRD